MPRRHAPTILDMTDDEAAEIMNKLRTAADALTKTFNPDGIPVYQHNGVASLQEVRTFTFMSSLAGNLVIGGAAHRI